jgi:hypothetical protein
VFACVVRCGLCCVFSDIMSWYGIWGFMLCGVFSDVMSWYGIWGMVVVLLAMI